MHSVVQIDQALEPPNFHIIALGPDGSLYVTDYADHRLRVVSSLLSDSLGEHSGVVVRHVG